MNNLRQVVRREVKFFFDNELNALRKIEKMARSSQRGTKSGLEIPDNMRNDYQDAKWIQKYLSKTINKANKVLIKNKDLVSEDFKKSVNNLKEFYKKLIKVMPVAKKELNESFDVYNQIANYSDNTEQGLKKKDKLKRRLKWLSNKGSLSKLSKSGQLEEIKRSIVNVNHDIDTYKN